MLDLERAVGCWECKHARRVLQGTKVTLQGCNIHHCSDGVYVYGKVRCCPPPSIPRPSSRVLLFSAMRLTLVRAGQARLEMDENYVHSNQDRCEQM